MVAFFFFFFFFIGSPDFNLKTLDVNDVTSFFSLFTFTKTPTHAFFNLSLLHLSPTLSPPYPSLSLSLSQPVSIFNLSICRFLSLIFFICNYLSRGLSLSLWGTTYFFSLAEISIYLSIYLVSGSFFQSVPLSSFSSSIPTPYPLHHYFFFLLLFLCLRLFLREFQSLFFFFYFLSLLSS